VTARMSEKHKGAAVACIVGGKMVLTRAGPCVLACQGDVNDLHVLRIQSPSR
jgi:hypothetical protein